MEHALKIAFYITVVNFNQNNFEVKFVYKNENLTNFDNYDFFKLKI